MSNFKGTDRSVIGAGNACTRERLSFQIGFEDRVRVDGSEMTRERIAKRRASMSKTTRSKSNVDKRGWQRRLREAERS